MVTEGSGYRLHEALLPVPCATIACARSQTLSTRMTRPLPAGFAHPTTAGGPAVIISSPGGLTFACQSQTNTNATNGINFLIFLVKDPSQQRRAESIICSGLICKVTPKCDEASRFDVTRPFSASNGYEIGRFAVERCFCPRERAMAIDRGISRFRSRAI